MVNHGAINLKMDFLVILIWPAFFLWFEYSFHGHLCFSKTAASYRELEARKSRVNDLEKLYMDMAMQKELQV